MALNITGKVKGRILARVHRYKRAHYASFPLHSRLSLAVAVRAVGPFRTEGEAVSAALARLADPADRARRAALLRADRAREARILAHAARFGPTG